MTIYLVWTSYEDVDAAFFKEADAEEWITTEIAKNPTFGGYRLRTRGDFGITEIEVK